MTEITTRYDSSGRIQPIESRNLWHPGHCALCGRIGRSPEEHFANLQVELDFFGSIYLCLDCCAEVAAFIQFLPPQDLVDTQVALERAEHANEVLTAQNEYLRGLLDARINLAGSSESDSDGDDGFSLPEIDDAADEIDRILESEQSKSA